MQNSLAKDTSSKKRPAEHILKWKQEISNRKRDKRNVGEASSKESMSW